MLLACQNTKENTEKKEDTKAQTETPTEKETSAEKEKTVDKEKPKAKKTPPKSPNNASGKAKLMGKWQSLEDPTNLVIFSPNNTDDPNISGIMAEGTRKVTFTLCEKDCQEYFKNQDGLTCDGMGFRIVEDGENIDFCIYTLTDSKLEYTMLGGRGNTLSFKKVK